MGSAALAPEVFEANLRAELEAYDAVGAAAGDRFGKTTLNARPLLNESSGWYVGLVTPVLHYCMGGVATNTNGSVLVDGGEGRSIEGLYAAGEIVGGIHGA